MVILVCHVTTTLDEGIINYHTENLYLRMKGLYLDSDFALIIYLNWTKQTFWDIDEWFSNQGIFL